MKAPEISVRSLIVYGSTLASATLAINIGNYHPELVRFLPLEARALGVSLLSFVYIADTWSSNTLTSRYPGKFYERFYKLKGLPEEPTYKDFLKPFPLFIAGSVMLLGGILPELFIPFVASKTLVTLRNLSLLRAK